MTAIIDRLLTMLVGRADSMWHARYCYPASDLRSAGFANAAFQMMR